MAEFITWLAISYVSLPTRYPAETAAGLLFLPPMVLCLLIYFNRSGRSRRR